MRNTKASGRLETTKSRLGPMSRSIAWTGHMVPSYPPSTQYLSPYRSHKNQTRVGFTLVELLVVISIIGFMSGMFLVAYRGALQESTTLKTRGTIQKISEVLSARMDEYMSYPVAIRTPVGGGIPSMAIPLPISSTAGDTTSVLRERARLLALRDIIRMEMPDHPDDIKFTTYWKGSRTPAQFQAFLEGRLPFTANPGLAVAIQTGLSVDATNGLFVKGTLTARTKALMTRLSASGWNPRNEWDKTNANAELLYLIVEGSDLNGSSAIELFGKSEIKDTDGDGLNEFIDAFGRPIRWIRWPAGFAGSSRYHPDMLDPTLVVGTPPNLRLTVSSEPIDRLGTDPGWGSAQAPGTGLTPLVISAGVDGAFGIRFREVDRYGSASAPTSVGNFDSKPSYSSAEAPWTLSAYGLTRFTDPWFPRVPSVLGIRMGELVTGAPSDFENERPVVANHAGDNISNFDGSAVSL